ncbi:hypothetical protein B0O99DRAFT_685008 [Bisporella sp. PMI_857]|nr:hypothetical protein B0O99DRAFT_685008 [Bisporella sp. PMI_857]
MHTQDSPAETDLEDSNSTLDSSVESLQISPGHLDHIWSRNATVPDPVRGCVHDLFKQIAENQPDAQAVSAWDGDFTYSQLDILTDKVAKQLVGAGIAPKTNIPIIFSKSRWTCVAMLGVIKAGCACIALDANQPNERLRSIVQQSQPKLIVSSSSNHARARLLADVTVLILDEPILERLSLSKETSLGLPVVSPDDIVYISFTSGTTGLPKGACISHENVRSAVYYQGEKLGFHQRSRVFDFAPYSFDVAWSNFLHSICSGACICIASEEEMLNDLYAEIVAFEATLINITPTVLRTISQVPPTLETVLLSGEMPYRENVSQWASRVRLINTYGPTECTWKCAFSVLTSSQQDRPDIGRGVGFCTWIVDPDDNDRLVPRGCVGELFLEGPLVGQGYLSDPEKTALAFITDPPWLTAGSESHSGRRGRLYKTGDLVKWKGAEDSEQLVFVGRKDSSQLKIRGQRVEIGDVEHHIRACLVDSLPIIADVIRPRDRDIPTLALFVVAKGQEKVRIQALMDSLTDKLIKVLPSFMTPSIYIPVDDIPLASTGKIDRRRLRDMGSAMFWKELIDLQSSILSVTQFHAPSNEVERALAQMWAQILQLDTTEVSATDNFFRLGGDSIAAMRLVSAARKRGFSLTVADVFRTPVLGDLAHIAKPHSISCEEEPVLPFSLLSGRLSKEHICKHVAKLCGTHNEAIEDVYPCTSLQQGMLASTLRSDRTPRHGEGLMSPSADYISRTVFELPTNINFELFHRCWLAISEHMPIIRTQIVDLSGEGLVQVVLKEPVPLISYAHFGQLTENTQAMGLGAALCRAGVIKCDPHYFYLEMHHSIFDGWTTSLILDALETAYRKGEASFLNITPFQPFIKHVLDLDTSKATAYWNDMFSDSEATNFPSPSYTSREKLVLAHPISDLNWPRTGITPTSIVHSALTVLLATYTNSNDIKYGATLSGRQAPIPGIDRMAGPTIATIPLRVKFDWNMTVDALQQQIQGQAVENTQYEQFGLQNIRRISEQVEEASQFQLLLVVQSPAQRTGKEPGAFFSQAKSIILNAGNRYLGEKSSSISSEGEICHDAAVKSAGPSLVDKDGEADNIGIYNSYAMMIICCVQDFGVSLSISFDTGAIEQEQVRHFALHFEHLLRQLSLEEFASFKLSDIETATRADLDYIWDRNRGSIDVVEETVTDIFDKIAGARPESIGISSWDQILTYREVKDLSKCVVSRLQLRGVIPGDIVILSFEKSAWMMVSMISVLKIGAIALPVSAPTSEQRAREIVQALQPKLAITSSGVSSSSFRDLVPTLDISQLVEPSDNSSVPTLERRQNLPVDPALVLFTSGSTGTPKSILWTHSTLSSNIRAATVAFGLTARSRVLQFAGYDFDVSTVESLSTLVTGGCLCIPSESDRTNRLTESIIESKANWICITPSVSETLNPSDLRSLETMVFAGEKLLDTAAFRWIETVKYLYNWYGPAEASVATTYSIGKQTWKSGIIGKSNSATIWLVDPKDSDKLAPIGAIAELCIEGPIVASYTGGNGPALNKSSFISPPWLRHGHSGIPGQHGLAYKTGDLAKYDTDGNITFIGRKYDSQRKLRGQRVELDEIELRVQSFLSQKLQVIVVAEIFAPSGSDKQVLVLFISPASTLDGIEDAENFVKMVLPVDELETHLAKFLPSYMIPKLYIPINKIPKSHAGKTDRRRLQQIGGTLTYEQIARLQPAHQELRKASTSTEKQLQQLWGDIIGIEANLIHANDNFFRFGGDSISAMRLVASARKAGLVLTVTQVFEYPQLEKMAAAVKQVGGSSEREIPPFSLLDLSINEDSCRAFVAQLCSVSKSQIADVYPCTPLQEGLLALGAKRHGQYISRSVLPLQANINTDRLRRAWEATVAKLAILRTRIVDLPKQGLVQVVLDKVSWRTGPDVATYVSEDQKSPMGLGTELCRYAIIDRHFILTIHHCTYDGSSLQMILDEVESQYAERPGINVTPFQYFIEHLQNIDQEKALNFWRTEISGKELRPFPILPSSAYEPQADDDLEYTIQINWPQTGITPSTIIRSAWTLLSTQYMSSSDVIFGVTNNGRHANLAGLENCVAPTISTVPFAFSVNWEESVASFLARIQRKVLETTQYEQYGLQNIQRARSNFDAELFQTLLVVQPVSSGKDLNRDSLLFKARTFSSNLNTRGNDPFNTHALMLVCELNKSGLHLHVSFDSKIIDKKQIHRIACQFETVLKQLCVIHPESTKLDSVQTVSDLDLDIFWTQNAALPEEPRTFIHDMVTVTARKHPDATAIDAWDGQFLYREVVELSDILCQKLIHSGVNKGDIVALCFEKSKWVPIVQQAVFKAGAISLLQSVAVPEGRLSAVFKRLDVHFAVASQARAEQIQQYAQCFTIDQLLKSFTNRRPVGLPELQMNDPAAILVSSGSTGEPKQILWSHKTIAANLIGHAKELFVTSLTRIFQFASYDFDVGTIEVISSLATSSVICIPSESERLDGLAAAINRFRANYINITPTTAKLLDPQQVPTISTIVLSGENSIEKDVSRWKGRCRVINWYGPAEVASGTFAIADKDNWHNGVIGWTDNRDPSLCWLVDPRNYNKLVPFGAIGEIAMEGHTCANGYIGNPERTELLFRKNPTFLTAGFSSHEGRKSGLIYRTGDLGRYGSDGALVYIGRKDAQVKIRGNLIAPEEVEFHIRQCLENRKDIQVIVDSILPENTDNLILAAFISPTTQEEVNTITSRLGERLAKTLPRYSIPSYYIPITSIPRGPTGKRDRARLQQIGATYTPPRQMTGTSTWREPSTSAERALRELWARSFGIEAEKISANDSFLRAGDSIQAMRLAGLARQQGLLLTVADIFQSPILGDMAKLLKNQDATIETTIEPFSLLKSEVDVDRARQYAASLCDVNVGTIEDIFPCTQLQEGLLALTVRHQGDYTGHDILRLDASVNLARFRAAWEKVVEAIPILRTRIVDLPEQGLVQVVIKEVNPWSEAESIEDFLYKESENPLGLTSPLMTCALIPSSQGSDSKKYIANEMEKKITIQTVENEKEPHNFDSREVETATERNDFLKDAGHQQFDFVLTMHHSIYDGLVTPLILETLESFYTGSGRLRSCPFQSFVKYVTTQDKEAEEKFWQAQFSDLEAAQFPLLPSPSYQPDIDSALTHFVEDIPWREDNSTPSTLIRSAWALLCSQYSNSSDVVFGTVVSGRKAAVIGIERMAGPTIATVPIRVKFSRDTRLSNLLKMLQTQATEMIRYEQTGLSRIRQVSDEAFQACQFQTLVIVQPQEQKMSHSSLFISGYQNTESDLHKFRGFTSYALTVICSLEANRLKIEICFDSAVLDKPTVHAMARQFEQLLKRICSDVDPSIQDLSVATDQDLDQIWRWNNEVPATIERCMHELISETTQCHPNSVAVSAWDGELTYSQLDRFSNSIGCRLSELGVKRNMIIPLCFEKSLWVPVAILSVLKAGGAVVHLDPSLPESRLRAIVQQVKPQLILSSASNEGLTASLGPKTLVLSDEFHLPHTSTTHTNSEAVQKLPKVDPSDLLYGVFTSGSTGTPKGCLIQHKNFASAVFHQRSIMGLNSSSRMYDFSSYTFDMTLWSTFHILCAGGTLCIPSEDDRKSNLTDSIREFRITDMFLTPTTSRLVDAKKIPTIRNIHLGGEQVSGDDATLWMPYANVMQSYGPAECSAATHCWPVSKPISPILTIGKGRGVSTWIVDPLSSDHLAPIGTIGELYLEGPLLGKGYLDNDEKTLSSFIENPTWLIRGSPDGSVPGRSGRLYRTGDLMRYNPDNGTMTFAGRKDTQVKLRGQRIELSEVEHHARCYLRSKLEEFIIISEVVVPKATQKATLLAFIQIKQNERQKLQEIIGDLDAELQGKLPSYMVPSAYIPLESIPMTASGKTHRKQLQEIGADLTMEQLTSAVSDTEGKPLSTEPEFVLHHLWSTVLPVSKDNIYANSSFLRVGGDSIAAMRLSALARTHGISLTVQNILATPLLSNMAKNMIKLEPDAPISRNEIPPFSLLKDPNNKERILANVSKQCATDVSNIEDIFPCTGVQKSLLSMTAKSDFSYIANCLLLLKENVDIHRFKRSWEVVSQTNAPILRNRIVDIPSEGLVQVQLNEPLEWDFSDNVKEYLERNKARTMGLATPLTRLAVAGDAETGIYCILTQHHAMYDGYSLDLLLQEVSNAYTGEMDHSPIAPFQAFIQHIAGTNQEEAKEFWRNEFSDFEGTPFPPLPHQDYQPKADSIVRREVIDIKWPSIDATASTIIRTAWSILTARYTDTQDVVFGAMVTGRQAALAGIDRMVAPLISVLPIRIKVDQQNSVNDLLSEVQKQSTAMIAYEHTELLDIRRINVETEVGSRFNTLLIVQPPKQDKSTKYDTGPFQNQSKIGSATTELDDFNPNAVMIMCQLTDTNGLIFEVSFDSKVIDKAQMERIASQFEHVLRQLCDSRTQAVEEITTISMEDIEELWNWNSVIPSPIQECVHDLISKAIKLHPQAPAICAWDGNLSYTELDDLASRLASHLTRLGVNLGTLVPLCFEKSLWYPVAALGVMKAGAACVAMDSTQPEERLRSIVNQVKPDIILSSATNSSLASRISGAKVVVVDRAHIPTNMPPTLLLKTQASDTLYIVFTSGSTGVPKGVVTTHGNFASAAVHQYEILNIKPGTRVFDFVSYNFDVSWSNTLQTLICGGCLCIPSEWERRNDISGSLNRMNANYVYFTPSVARSLEPSSMPGIRTLAMGGEPIQSIEVSRWTQAETIIGIYGPAECAQALSFVRLSTKTRNNHVGHSFGARTWLAEPGRPERLAAIGTIGELLIEGPTVSKGYFSDLERTAVSYIEDPEWLSQGSLGHAGRQGRLYKTGDLLRQNSDGSLDFIGRKDGMIKLRGQRIELGEVEYHVRSSLQDPGTCEDIVAEIIIPQNSTSPILAVFLSLSEKVLSQVGEDTQSKLMRVIDGLEDLLSERVPQYMIPGAYIYVEKIPMTTTNKTDRRRLRELGSTQTMEKLAELQSHGKQQHAPSTMMEKRLQKLWSRVLGIETGSITAESSFLRIGGESISAMRLVAAAREQNLSLTVADIFNAPRLSKLALLVRETNGEEYHLKPHVAFSLLKTNDATTFIRQFIQPFIEPAESTIRDVFPATDFQVRAVLDALEDPPSRFPHWILDLPEHVDFVELQQACRKLVKHFEILSTVFVEANGGFWQVVLADLEPIYDNFNATGKDISSFLNKICREDLRRPRQLGRSFVRFMAVKHELGQHKLVFRISHAQFDGYSWGMVLKALSSVYVQHSLFATGDFAQYIAFNESRKQRSLEYWAARLQDSPYPSWVPVSPFIEKYISQDRLTMKRTIKMPNAQRHEGISAATIFHAACVLVFAKQFRQREVVCGRLVTGRSMLPGSLQNVVGPCMTEVPIRTTVEVDDTVSIIALRLQKQFIEDSAYEAAGMVEIINNCTSWPNSAQDFGWRTAFQQEEDVGFTFLGAPSKVSFYETDLLPRPRPEIYATPRNGKLDLEFEGNRKLITEDIVGEFLDRLGDLLGGF